MAAHGSSSVSSSVSSLCWSLSDCQVRSVRPTNPSEPLRNQLPRLVPEVDAGGRIPTSDCALTASKKSMSSLPRVLIANAIYRKWSAALTSPVAKSSIPPMTAVRTTKGTHTVATCIGDGVGQYSVTNVGKSFRTANSLYTAGSIGVVNDPA